ERRQLLFSRLGPAPFDCDIPALGIAELLQLFEKRRHDGAAFGGRLSRENPEMPYFRRLLRIGRNCQHRHADSRKAQRATAVHSVTSSARSKNRGGKLNPISFAVLRLITSRITAGWSSGNSPGLAPFRMRPA